MGDQRGYSAEFVREMSMQAFELVIDALKERGGEDQRLGEVADAAFLLWQLAREETVIAQRTILEFMPVLVGMVYGGDRNEDENRFSIDNQGMGMYGGR